MSDYDETLHSAQSLSPDERLKLIARLWASLPHEIWPTPTEGQLNESHRRITRQGLPPGEAVPWPVVEQMLADCVRSSRPTVYSAPRRFDLATIFVVTSAYALLFGGMALLRIPAGASLLVAGFITIVGIGQALLFQGLRPRTASILVGIVVYMISMFGIFVFASGMRMYPGVMFLTIVVYGLIGGTVLGYLAGAVVGSVFLLADYARRRIPNFRSSASADAVTELSPFDAS
jgi:putative addiction module component (TIGR02574 family)